MPGSALERVAASPSSALSLEETLQWAEIFSKTELVPKALQGRPEAVALVGAMGAELGVPFLQSLSDIHPIEGKPSPSAQLRLGLIRRAGHEARFVESDEERAVLRGRRKENRNDPDAWTTVTWTIEMARKAGLLDQWVERWQTTQNGKRYCEKFVLDRPGVEVPDWVNKEISAGRVKSKDNWQRYPADMLRARAASSLSRMEFSDVILGLRAGEVYEHTAEELGQDVGQDVDEPFLEDDDVIDAEVVEHRGQGETETRRADQPGDGGSTPPARSEADPPASPNANEGEGAEGADAAAMPGATAPPGEVQGQTIPAGAAPEPTPHAQGQGDDGNPAVAAPDGPAPTSPSPGQWKEWCRANSVTQGALLRQARTLAGESNLPVPSALEEISDQQLITPLLTWLRQSASSSTA